jgi:uncharacterized protein YkwD
MKYPTIGTLCVLTAVFGIATAVRSDDIILEPSAAVSQPPSATTVPTSNSTPVMSEIELAIYNRVNLYRMSLDLPPLVIDPVISAQAKAHSQEMARTGTMSHDGFRERVDSVAKTITYRSAAENVATNMGYKQPDVQAIEGWIESPGHHRNMIGRFDLTGIGVVQDAKGEYYFTQIFIRKLKQQ